MPRYYNKRRFKKRYRKRYPRKARSMSKADMAYSLARRAMYKANFVKGNLNVEYKFEDITSTAAQDDTPQLDQVFLVAQGDTASTRSGNSVKLKAMHVRMKVEINSSATNTIFRWMVIQWFEDSTPAPADILANTSAVDSFLNINQSRNYKVISSKIINLNQDKNPWVFYNKSFKLNTHVKYDGANTTDVTNGGLYILTFSSEETNTPAYTYTIRTRYIDN